MARELVHFSSWSVIFAVFVSEAFFGLKKASNWSVSSPKKIAVNVSLFDKKSKNVSCEYDRLNG